MGGREGGERGRVTDSQSKDLTQTSESSAIFPAAKVIDDLTSGGQVMGDGYRASAARNSRG